MGIHTYVWTSLYTLDFTKTIHSLQVLASAILFVLYWQLFISHSTSCKGQWSRNRNWMLNRCWLVIFGTDKLLGLSNFRYLLNNNYPIHLHSIVQWRHRLTTEPLASSTDPYAQPTLRLLAGPIYRAPHLTCTVYTYYKCVCTLHTSLVSHPASRVSSLPAKTSLPIASAIRTNIRPLL